MNNHDHTNEINKLENRLERLQLIELIGGIVSSGFLITGLVFMIGWIKI